MLAPTITAPPSPTLVDLRIRAQETDLDPGQFADVLITALPASLRQLAATNIPAASRELWSEFLDDKTPSWFAALPTNVQGYLKDKYGPTTVKTTSSSSQTESATPSPTATASSQSSHGLSRGQYIGIGLGAFFAILLLSALFLVLCVVCRRRRRRKAAIKRAARPPTPMAFAGNSSSTHGPLGAAHHGGADAVYGHDPSHEEIYKESSVYQDYSMPAPVAPRSRRNSRSSRMSHSSLHSVIEEPEHDTEARHAQAGVPLTSSRSAGRPTDQYTPHTRTPLAVSTNSSGQTYTDTSASHSGDLNNSNTTTPISSSPSNFASGGVAHGHSLNPFRDGAHPANKSIEANSSPLTPPKQTHPALRSSPNGEPNSSPNWPLRSGHGWPESHQQAWNGEMYEGV